MAAMQKFSLTFTFMVINNEPPQIWYENRLTYLCIVLCMKYCYVSQQLRT